MMTSLVVTALFLMFGASAQAATNHVAEVYFVVEPQVIRNYMQFGYNRATAITTIKGDIDYYIYQVNELYKSMANYGINIEIRQKYLTFMDNGEEMFEACKLIRGNELQSDLALAVFGEWLEKTDARNKIGYDIALVWTGFDIFGGSGNKAVTGYASTKAACTESAVAIVEFDGTMSGAITTAHELGHSLGSPHDQGGACPASEGYIMTPISTVRNKHRWEFSSCSIQSIVDYINSLSKANNNCLVKTSTPPSLFRFSTESGRDILNVEKTCVRVRKAPNSYFCEYDNFYNGNDIKGDPVCKTLYCGEIGTSSCMGGMPPDGMVCDVNKRCDKGRCVAASFPTPNGIDPECVFGDIHSNFVNHESLTCPQAVAKYSASLCYGIHLARSCCKTCGALKTNVAGCEYGDKSTGCQKYTASQICSGAKNRQICCYKCRNYVGKRSAVNETIVELTENWTVPVVHPVLVEDPIPVEVPVNMD